MSLSNCRPTLQNFCAWPAGIGFATWFAGSGNMLLGWLVVQATLTTCSMATCSVVLLSILKTAGSLVSEQEEAHFMAGCQRFYTQ